MISFALCEHRGKDRGMIINILSKAFGIEFEEIRERFIKSMDAEDVTMYFIILDTEIVGVFELATDIFQNFGILPKYQRRGIGTRVVKDLIHIHKSLRIHNNPSPNGKKIYDKFPTISYI